LIEILIHASDENQMLSDMCRNIVQTAGYHQAWVGLRNESGVIYPAAQSGYPDGYLEQSSFAAEKDLADGLPDLAVTTGHLQVIQDAINDPTFTATRMAAERFGFGSFLSIPLISEREKLGVICIYAKEARAFDDEEVRLLTELANDMAYGIMNLRQGIKYRNTSEKLQLAMEKTIFAIATTVEMRDPYTAGHERRVGELACAIARELGLSEDRIHGIRLASIVHDMGKINIPAEILSKPTRLTALEYKLIQTHAQSGYDILKDVDFPWPIAQIVHQHHERMDGSGYPQGLKGEETILEARIVAVADTVEAMASHRPYRAALGPEIALEEIQKNRGRFYDPDVADACIRLFREKNFEFSS